MPFDNISSRRYGIGLEEWRAIAFNGVMQDHADYAATAGAPDQSLNALIIAVGRNRDRHAFARVFGHFGPRIKSYLVRRGCDVETAEEVVQEVMVTLWRRADQFDPSQANASTWIFTIARNKRIDFLRRDRRLELDPDDPALVPSAEEPADRIVESAQDSVRVRSAIENLPDDQRLLLELAYFEDKSHSVIAEEQGLPLGTVKSRIRLAMGRLRKSLQDG